MWNHEIAEKVIKEIESNDNLEKWLIDLKTWIDPDEIEDPEVESSIQVTIGFNNDSEWSYQTGNNEYTGNAYGFPHWIVTEVYEDTTPKDFIESLRNFSNSIMG